MKITEIEMEEKPFEYFASLSKDDEALLHKVYELGENYFKDMMFQPESVIGDFMKVSMKCPGDDEWHTAAITLPNELEYFTYTWFDFHVEHLDCDGCFDIANQTLLIDSACKDNDNTILHEMIHLHETVLETLPAYYKETLFIALYWHLRNLIPDLDEIMKKYGHIYEEDALTEQGGQHGLLFLLKSFDLDIKKGLPLGTVMGYGKRTEFEEYTYNTEPCNKQ